MKAFIAFQMSTTRMEIQKDLLFDVFFVGLWQQFNSGLGKTLKSYNCSPFTCTHKQCFRSILSETRYLKGIHLQVCGGATENTMMWKRKANSQTALHILHKDVPPKPTTIPCLHVTGCSGSYDIRCGLPSFQSSAFTFRYRRWFQACG